MENDELLKLLCLINQEAERAGVIEKAEDYMTRKARRLAAPLQAGR